MSYTRPCRGLQTLCLAEGPGAEGVQLGPRGDLSGPGVTGKKRKKESKIEEKKEEEGEKKKKKKALCIWSNVMYLSFI